MKRKIIGDKIFICPCHNKKFKTKDSLDNHLWRQKHPKYQKHQKIYNSNYWLTNKEKVKKIQANFHINNPNYKKIYQEEHKKDKQIYQKNYDKENAYKKSSYMQVYFILNKEKISIRMYKYNRSEEGKLLRLAQVHNRRIRQIKSSQLTKDKIKEVYKNNILRFNILTCELCFKQIKKGKSSLEHFIPISRHKDFPNVDLNSLKNLGISHLNCNNQKFNLTLEEWFQKYSNLKND